MKLGLVIKVTNSGVGEAYSLNKNTDWARHICDVRIAINTLIGFDGSGKSVILAKFLGVSGYLLCIIKARSEGSGRGGDNVAAWIHIPANCCLASSEILDLLNRVEMAVSASIKIDTETLRTLFDQDYGESDVMLSATSNIVSNSSKKFALRYYNNGDFTMNELFGKAIAQQEYSSYEGVFFVDKRTGITSYGDVLSFEPKEICTLLPLSKIDGFIPCFLSQGKYIPFTKAIEMVAGSPITIHWHKEGYAIVKKTFVAQKGPECPDSARIVPSDYKLIVKREHFHIYDPNSVPINDATIAINDKPMVGNYMEISESAYNKGVRLSVRAKDFAEYRRENEKLSKNMRIFMGHNSYHYDFEIPLCDGENKYASFSIDTRHKLKHCPIKGYATYDFNIHESNRGVNRLEATGDWKLRIKYFLYGMLSVILVAFLYAGYSALENYEAKSEATLLPSNSEDGNQDVDSKEMEMAIQDVDSKKMEMAIHYLEKDEWHKDSLDNYPITEGLFEALNTFDIDKLKAFDDKLSPKSPKLQDIVSKLGSSIEKGVDPKVGKEPFAGKYNSPNDKKINIKNYINWVSNRHEPAPKKAPSDPQKTKGSGHDNGTQRGRQGKGGTDQ